VLLRLRSLPRVPCLATVCPVPPFPVFLLPVLFSPSRSLLPLLSGCSAARLPPCSFPFGTPRRLWPLGKGPPWGHSARNPMNYRVCGSPARPGLAPPSSDDPGAPVPFPSLSHCAGQIGGHPFPMRLLAPPSEGPHPGSLRPAFRPFFLCFSFFLSFPFSRAAVSLSAPLRRRLLRNFPPL
jgi:hypothetical protein